MFFEGFEGFKKIKNDEKNLKVEEVIELLEKYKEAVGEIYIDELEGNLIHIKGDENSLVDILVDSENIIIERKSEIEDANKIDSDTSFEQGKDLSVAKTDRLIEQIYDLINEFKSQGKAVIMISSEMPEILGLSDRILVLSQGVITGEFDIKYASQEAILKCAVETKEAI